MNLTELKKRTDQLCFFKQAIFYVEPAAVMKREIDSYELLLRDGGNQNRFPLDLFKEFVKSDETNRIYWDGIEENLISILSQNKNDKFAINIDPQQLYFESTFDFFKKIEEYKGQLLIEITEAVPWNRPQEDYFSPSLKKYIKRFYDMGYKVAMDDISSGMNSLNMVKECAEYISRIKLSLIQLDFDDQKVVQQVIIMWGLVAQYLKVEIVIEGIDTVITNIWVSNNILGLQQGFYLSTPNEVEK